ncbi:MAG: SLBB domain-containing protein [Myxococcota bacterium]
MMVPARKNIRDVTVETLAPPPQVRIPLDGTLPLVDVGERVTAGQRLAQTPEGALFRCAHSPLTGRVLENRGWVEVVGELEPPRPIPGDPSDDVVLAAREAGLVGMGGGLYPTYAKLEAARGVEWLIVNGCESEPYVTCDQGVLTAYGDEVEGGAAYAAAAVGARHTVVVSDAPYPGGDERTLVATVCGVPVPVGGLPRDVGAVVLNVQTVRSLWLAVEKREPLVSRVVTVAGGAVARPGNYEIPLGTPIGHVLEQCDVDIRAVAVLLEGGPMMGEEVTADDVVGPGTVAILALTRNEVAEAPVDEPCIRCGRCMSACPYALPVPLLLDEPCAELRRCVECGVCQFVCPARRALVPLLREAKRGLGGVA